MSGRKVSAVLVPRYTTYVGPGNFTTLPIDISAFDRIELLLWRGQLVGTGVSLKIYLEQSGDRDEWPLTAAIDPAADTEILHGEDLDQQFFRIRTNLTGTGPAVTLYAYGNLIHRQK